jgi:hypothetical protein
MHVRRTRTRKALVSDKALSVSEVQAIGGYEEVEGEMTEEMLRPKKRRSRYSKYGEEGYTYRTCSN